MRVVVYGAGAVGSLFAALLARAGESVLVVGRPEHVRAIRDTGLRVEGSLDGTWRMDAQDRISGPLGADLVLLTVKSFDLDRAARQLAPSLPRPTPILLPQNGLGIEAIVERALREAPDERPKHPLVRAVNTLPVTLVSAGRIRYAGSGEVRLAEPRGESATDRAARTFFDLFQRASVPVRWVSDFETALWTKAVINAAVNPVTAAYSVLNGALASSPYRETTEALALEGIAASEAAGHPLHREEVLEELWRTVSATATNRSSMLQDVDRGRPTEIDAISGALLVVGQSRGVAMPETAAIIGRVQARPAAKGQRS